MGNKNLAEIVDIFGNQEDQGNSCEVGRLLSISQLSPQPLRYSPQ